MCMGNTTKAHTHRLIQEDDRGPCHEGDACRKFPPVAAAVRPRRPVRPLVELQQADDLLLRVREESPRKKCATWAVMRVEKELWIARKLACGGVRVRAYSHDVPPRPRRTHAQAQHTDKHRQNSTKTKTRSAQDSHRQRTDKHIQNTTKTEGAHTWAAALTSRSCRPLRRAYISKVSLAVMSENKASYCGQYPTLCRTAPMSRTTLCPSMNASPCVISWSPVSICAQVERNVHVYVCV